jgi:hypothetical protein
MLVEWCVGIETTLFYICFDEAPLGVHLYLRVEQLRQ